MKFTYALATVTAGAISGIRCSAAFAHLPTTGIHSARTMPPTGFFEPLSLFPFLSSLPALAPALLEELRAAPPEKWHAWPETTLYMAAGADGGSGAGAPQPAWTVIPFCYTFPSDTGDTKWVPSSCAVLPRAAAALRALPGLKTALLSRLGPGTRLAPHQGWKEISNHVLRCHLALRIPQPGASGVTVEGSTRLHEEGALLCFDDSLTHSAFNEGAEDRVVLIFDIARPAGVPEGTAQDGATAELESFMAYFS